MIELSQEQAVADAPHLPIPADSVGTAGAPCGSGRCRDGSPCRRTAALAELFAPRVMEETEHG